LYLVNVFKTWLERTLMSVRQIFCLFFYFRTLFSILNKRRDSLEGVIVVCCVFVSVCVRELVCVSVKECVCVSFTHTFAVFNWPCVCVENANGLL
jgi:hypothetical protein